MSRRGRACIKLTPAPPEERKTVVTKTEVEAEILNLGAMILMGKVTTEDLERVTKLAQDNKMLKRLGEELSHCQLILT